MPGRPLPAGADDRDVNPLEPKVLEFKFYAPRGRPGARRERVGRAATARSWSASSAERVPPGCTGRPVYVITYKRMSDGAIALVGPRVRALREAGGWSLRDLADRCGVSAPMLSQVERGETSPTLQVAARIARGLDLRLSQLLRLDEDGAVSIVRAASGAPAAPAAHRYEILTPPLPGQRAEVSRHALAPGAATGGPGDPPMHEPGARETAVVRGGRRPAPHRRRRARPRRRRQRDLRRRPAPPLREPRKGGGRPAGRRVGGAAPLMSPTTLFEKIWAAHEVAPGLVYIDLHLVHEVTSPQAFDGLRLAGRRVRRPDRTLATADHNVPTDGTPVAARIRDELSRVQVETLERNCAEFGIPIYSLGSERQGIVHVIGPELGVTQPGMTIVCGDSHTATHGAFGALAFGIGTSEVEHVLATQTLSQPKPKSMRIRYEGELGAGVTAKDLILGTIGQMGTNGAAGHAVEYAGPAIEGLSMEGRMTICNMTIEGGGRAGMVAPDDTTFALARGPRRGAGRPRRGDRGVARACARTRVPRSTASWSWTPPRSRPLVTWGTTPAQVVGVGDAVPEPRTETDERALRYMALEPGTPMQDVRLDRVFIGSCTNSRIGDLRAAAQVVEGRMVSPDVRAMVVPGSEQVRAQAEAEGLDRVFRAAGFDWRTAGCSMCLGMNPDILAPGERCASTSNRNFEGRQGRGGRTHLVSPVMAAAAAIEGHFVDIRTWS